MIVRADSLEYMRSMNDNSVDLIFTDPPWDEYKDLIVFIEEIKRVAKRWIIFGREYSTTELSLENTIGICSTRGLMFNGASNMFFERVFMLRENENEYPDHHSRVFPLTVAREIIEHCSLPGELVFDPFCGTGTIPKAAQETGRKFMGCEIKRELSEFSARRLA